jgi:hypothetical protein
MKRMHVVLLMWCGVLAASSSAALVQPTGAAIWSVSIQDADTSERPRTFRLYENVRSLRLQFLLSNDSGAPLFVTARSIGSAVTLNLSRAGGDPVAVIAEPMSDVLHSQWRTRFQTGSDTPIEIEPGSSVSWISELRRADGQRFEDGAYTVEVLFPRLSSLEDPTTGEQWKGRHPITSNRIHVIVGVPVSTAERTAAAQRVAKRAESDGRPDDAIDALQDALRDVPDDAGLLIELASVYLRLGRYGDAIVPLQRVYPLSFGKRTAVPNLLALAYVGIKDERSATAVLRASGFADGESAELILRFREQVARGRK